MITLSQLVCNIKSLFALSLIGLLSFSCSKKEGSDFKKFYSHLGIIKTPIKISCNTFESNVTYTTQLKSIAVDKLWFNALKEDSTLVKRYLPKNMEIIFGRIVGEGEYTFVLYESIGDVMHHYVYVYDGSGKTMDSVSLIDGYCGSDELMENSIYAFIDNDRTITMGDTTKSFVIDPLDSINSRRHTSTTSSIKILSLTASGKFKVIRDTAFVIWEAKKD